MSDTASLAPQSIVSRPLDKGMRTNVPSQGLATGGVDVLNYHVTSNGLRRRSGIQPLITTDPFGQIDLAANEFILGIEVFWAVGGAKSIVAITNMHAYITTDMTTWAEVRWCRQYNLQSFDSGLRTVTIPTTSYDFDDDLTGDRIKVGMYVELTNGSLRSRHRITNVATATLTLADWPAFTPSTGAGNLSIYRYFSVNDPFTVQWANSPYGIFCVDGTNSGILKIAEATLGGDVVMSEHLCHDGVSTNVRVFSGAVSVAYISGRLVVGGTTEYSGRQRVRWSLISNLQYFDPRDYTDCTQAKGTVSRVYAMEEYPIVLLTDSLYAGQPYATTSEDSSAWIFRPVEVAGSSMVGPNAFTRVPNGLVYLGKSDFYLISPLKRTEKGDFKAEPMQCPIFRDFFRDKSKLYRTRLAWNSSEEAVMASIPDNSGDTFSDIVYFYTKTSEWSYHRYGMSFTSLQDLYAKTSELWDDYNSVQWNAAPGLTWFGTMSGFELPALMLSSDDGILYTASLEGGTDGRVSGTSIVQSTIQSIYETGDVDYDMPDQNKSAYKVSIRMGGRTAPHTANISYSVSISMDKGRNWKDLGHLVIDPDSDENELHFRSIGTNHRYRFVIDSDQSPFNLEEITYRIRLSGQQIARGMA